MEEKEATMVSSSTMLGCSRNIDETNKYYLDL